MKKDIKYIIKKVIIYVLVALILGFLGKNSVFADSVNNYINISDSNNQFIITNTQVDNSTLIDSLSVYNINLNLTSTLSSDNAYYILFYSSTYNDYMLYFFGVSNGFITDSLNYSLLYSNDSNSSFLPPNIFSINSSLLYSDLNNYLVNNDTLTPLYDFMTYQKYNVYKILQNDNNLSISTHYSYSIDNTYKIINTNISKNLLKYTNEKIFHFYEYNQLDNYKKIDLSGYQALLAVPKNYPYLASEYGFIENNVEQIHYSFGYEKCVRPTLIDITTLSNWYSNTLWEQGFVNNIEEISPDNNYNEYCSDTAELMSIDYAIQTENNYNYMALLIYNNSTLYDNNSQDWVNNQSNPYGTSYVYVNEEFYDYYLIRDYNSFNQTIDFTDFDSQNTTLFISTLPTFNDLIDMTKSQTELEDNLSTRQKIDKILSFVKLPFDFFKRTITAECRPLSARFPHGNFDIELPCLSSSFESFMGSTLYNVIRLIINGLLTYRVILSLVIFTTKKLDPKDAHLEVGALL